MRASKRLELCQGPGAQLGGLGQRASTLAEVRPRKPQQRRRCILLRFFHDLETRTKMRICFFRMLGLELREGKADDLLHQAERQEAVFLVTGRRDHRAEQERLLGIASDQRDLGIGGRKPVRIKDAAAKRQRFVEPGSKRNCPDEP